MNRRSFLTALAAAFALAGCAHAPPEAPIITTTSPLPAALVGSDYSFQFTATGTPPIKWRATSFQFTTIKEPSVKWKMSGRLSRVKLSPSGVLTFRPDPDDASLIINLTAENVAGQFQYSFAIPIR